MIIFVALVVGFIWLEVKLVKMWRNDKKFRKALIERTITRQQAQRYMNRHPFLYPPMLAIKYNQMIEYLEDESNE